MLDWIERYNTEPARDQSRAARVLPGPIEQAREWSEYYGRPIHVGEFGCLSTADPASRGNYYRPFARPPRRAGIGWAIWDWKAGFRYWDEKAKRPDPGMHRGVLRADVSEVRGSGLRSIGWPTGTVGRRRKVEGVSQESPAPIVDRTFPTSETAQILVGRVAVEIGRILMKEVWLAISASSGFLAGPAIRFINEGRDPYLCPHPKTISRRKTPMGATILPGAGVTFRVSAPSAVACLHQRRLQRVDTGRIEPAGHRRPGATGRASSRASARGPSTSSIINGTGSTGYKRDPYARELTLAPAYPQSNCVIRSPDSYPWHDQGFQMPAFNDLVIYQFHIGTYYGTDSTGTTIAGAGSARSSTSSTASNTWSIWGSTPSSRCRSSSSPPRPAGLQRDRLLLSRDGVHDRSRGRTGPLCHTGQPAPPGTRFAPFPPGTLDSQVNQLKALIDVCHVYGIAVLLDVVYNHAGGGFDDDSIYFFDRQPTGDNNRSLYFTTQGYVGGLIFAYWNADVRQFLINNAVFYVEEFHVNGYRYDEVTVIDQFGGWGLCQNLTDTLHFVKTEEHPRGRVLESGPVVGDPADVNRRRRLRRGLVAELAGRGARGDRPGGRRGRCVRLAGPSPGRALSPVQFPRGLAVGPLRREPRHRLRRQRPAGREAQRW